MNLFNGKIEQKERFAKRSESHYEFMNMSPKAEYVLMRAKIEEWFSHYPAKEKYEFIKRFQTDNDEQFISVFFELLSHEILLKLDYKIIIHPHLPKSEKHPDFLIHNCLGEEFYIEVATITNKSPKEIGRHKLLDNAMDIINEVKTLNYFIDIDIIKFPTSAVSASKIRNDLQIKLNELNPDHCEDIIKNFGWDAVPNWSFNDHGLKIKVMPIPRDKKYRNTENSNPIGITHYPMQFNRLKKSLVSTLKNKANKYGNLDKPYIIALNMLDMSLERGQIMETLFGLASYSGGSINSYSERLQNGFWYSKMRATCTRVSAVLFAKNLFPWALGMNDFKIYHNPWAKFSYNGKLCQFPHSKLVGNIYKETPGVVINKILDIPEMWPHNKIIT